MILAGHRRPQVELPEDLTRLLVECPKPAVYIATEDKANLLKSEQIRAVVKGMAGAGAAFVLVIDPSPRFYYQFHAVRHFVGDADGERTHFLPVGIEDVPAKLAAFDTVFSMGVLYHRPSPLDHLLQLKDALVPGGELVLETLVGSGKVEVFVKRDAEYYDFKSEIETKEQIRDHLDGADQSVITQFERWWDKYQVSLKEIERELKKSEEILKSHLKEIGYE